MSKTKAVVIEKPSAEAAVKKGWAQEPEADSSRGAEAEAPLTKPGVLIEVPLSLIDPSASNPRKKFKGIEELSASIAMHGILQNLVIRKHPSKEGRYELIAGERRWRAGTMADPDLIAPAKLVEMSDVEVLETQIVENLMREDVNPIEEAESFNAILETGAYGPRGTAANQKIADKIGKTTSYVYQRLKLLEMIPEVREALLEEKITAHHAVPIARLPIEQQKALIEELIDYDDRVMSVEALNEHIQTHVLLKLSAAPWKKDDADLLPMAGACLSCPKRTGFNPDLFEDAVESKDDRCSDPTCFEDKLKAFEERKVAQVAEELGQKPILISKSYTRRKDVSSLGDYDSKFKEAKKEDPGAIPALFVDGKEAGKVVYVQPKSIKADGSPNLGTSSAVTPQRREELRMFKVEQTTRLHVYSAVLAEMDGALGDSVCRLTDNLSRVLAAVAVKVAIMDANSVGDTQDHARHPGRKDALDVLGFPKNAYSHDLRKQDHSKTVAKVQEIDAWRSMFIAATYDEISYKDGQKPSGLALFTFADVLGIDVEMIRKEADFELLSAKAKKEIDEGTRVDPRSVIKPLDLDEGEKPRATVKAAKEPKPTIYKGLSELLDIRPTDDPKLFRSSTKGNLDAIVAGNACSTFSEGKRKSSVREVFLFAEKKWVCVGSVSSGRWGNESAHLREIVPAAEFSGETFFGYHDRTYSGVIFSCHGQDFVIVGDKESEITVRLWEEEDARIRREFAEAHGLAEPAPIADAVDDLDEEFAEASGDGIAHECTSPACDCREVEDCKGYGESAVIEQRDTGDEHVFTPEDEADLEAHREGAPIVERIEIPEKDQAKAKKALDKLAQPKHKTITPSVSAKVDKKIAKTRLSNVKASAKKSAKEGKGGGKKV